MTALDDLAAAQIALLAAHSHVLAAIVAWPAPIPPPPPAPAPTPGVGPSGIPMPVSEPSGWRRIFDDDFNTPLALGQWFSDPNNPSSGGTAKWGAYPRTWPDTSKTGRYLPEKVLSIHDGALDVFLHTDAATGTHCVAAPWPRIPRGQTGLRISVCAKADPIPGYKSAWLLWPDSEVWPRDGECDWPEGSFDRTLSGYMHRQGATTGGDQALYEGSVPWAGRWHTFVSEWRAGQFCHYILDGTTVLSETLRVPSTPMHYVLQCETNLTATPPSQSAQGHVLVDWVTIGVPA